MEVPEISLIQFATSLGIIIEIGMLKKATSRLHMASNLRYVEPTWGTPCQGFKQRLPLNDSTANRLRKTNSAEVQVVLEDRERCHNLAAHTQTRTHTHTHSYWRKREP